MDLISTLWIFSIIATLVLVSQKRLSGWFVFWSFFFGPIVALMAFLRPDDPAAKNPDVIANLQTEITTLKLDMQNLRRRITELEKGGLTESAAPAIVPTDEGPAPQQSAVPLTDTELADLADVPPQPEPVASPPPMETPSPEIPEDIPASQLSRIAVSQKSSEYKYTNSKEPSNAEINFGQFWLNKIGIVIFTLGVGFFISYSFQYFSPLLKDLLGYTVAGVLFYLGRRFEKQEKLKNYGLALLGAGWALTYFTTYALHHFEASRVIANQYVDITLLFAVAVGMMLHSLKAKSETMMMVSLGVAYVTSLIGEVTTFTFLSSMILGIVVVFLLYRFQWIKTLFLGLCMTYGIHFLFIAPAIGSGELSTFSGMNPGPSLNLAFLGAYWLLYFVGTHLVKGEEDVSREVISAANFSNFILFFVMSGPVFQDFYPDHRVPTLVVMALVYGVAAMVARAANRMRLYAGNLVIAVFALALAAYLQYLPNTSLMIWFVQTPFILYAGQKYKDVVLRYVGYTMSWLCLVRFVFVFDWNNAAAYAADVTFTTSHVTALVGCVAMAGCYWISRKGRERFLDVFDLGTVFCTAAIFYLTACVWSLTQGPWLYLFLLLEVPVLLWMGQMIKEKVPAASAHALTWLAVLMPVFSVSTRSAVVDFTLLGQTLNSWEWTYFFGSIALWVSFWLVRPVAREAARRDAVHVDDHVYSAFAALLMNLWLWAILDGKWLTTGLTIEAVVLINAALLFTLKRLRVYGYLVLVAVMFRYILIDDYIGAGALKWLLILLELGTFFGLYLISFFKKEENDKAVQLDEIETNGLFAGFMVMFVTTVFEHFAWSWRSLGLGGGAVALIVLGLRTRDKVARIGGFLLLGGTLLRIVFVDLARLTTIYKIISFIVIGALLLGLSFLYNKYFVGEKNDA